ENSDYTSACIRAFAFLPAELRKRCSVERRRYEDLWREIVKAASEAGYIPDGVSLDVVRLMLLGAVNWAGEGDRPNRVPIADIAAGFAARAAGPGRSSNKQVHQGEMKTPGTARRRKLRR